MCRASEPVPTPDRCEFAVALSTTYAVNVSVHRDGMLQGKVSA